MIFNKNFITSLLVIFISLIISILISKYNLKNYDKNVKYNDRYYHQMIKTDSLRYFSHGNEIKEDVKNGESFFQSGRENYTKYLPPRIAAIYLLLIDKDLFKDENKELIQTGIFFSYLVIQNLLYYLSIFCLLIASFKKCNNAIIFIVSYLCLEPTIIQYNGTFWSESIFFSLQIFLLALTLSDSQKLSKFFLIGFLLAILALQKQMAFFYIIILVIFNFIFLKEKKFLKLFVIVFTYFLILSLLAINNYNRSGKLYVLTSDTKLNFYLYLVRKVEPKHQNISRDAFEYFESQKAKKWLEKNNVNFEKDSSYIKNKETIMNYRLSILNEADRVAYDNYVSRRSINIILKNPSIYFKHILVQSLHTLLLNPFHIFSDHNYRSGEKYYGTEVHKNLIKYRIAYSMILYIICLVGLIYILKKKEFKLLILLFFSFSYFYFLVSWHGNTRYFVPCLIYMSILFGYGISSILNKYSKNN